MNQARLNDLLDAFPRRSVALVGDLFLDRYLELTSDEEFSVETGLEAYQIQCIRNAPGALGTVLNNLAALGVGTLLPVTVIGEDGHGFDLRQSLRELPLDDTYVISDAGRMTPTYTKPLRPANGSWQELNRLDVRTRSPLAAETEATLLSRLDAAWEAAEGLIVLDQISDAGCGVITRNLRNRLAELAKRDREKLVIVDSREFLGEFQAGDLKGNRREILQAARMDGAAGEGDALPGALETLHQRNGQRVFCTDGPQGIWVADDHGVRQVPGRSVAGPIDIVGAGDTVSATLAACLLSGATADEAAELANAAASISIQKIGQTGVATPGELRETFQE